MTLMLIILDGWGLREQREANAIKLGHVPNFNRLWESGAYPITTLGASAESVGLPTGQIGGSEVGHLNIGAGTVPFTDLSFIDHEVKTGDILNNTVLNDAMDRAARHGTLHLMGLVSDGGVHSQMRHLKSLISMAKARGVTRLAVHAFTDGRDVPPNTGKGFIEELKAYLTETNSGQIATVIGRYYAMDRDERWDRLEVAYRAMVDGTADLTVSDPVEAVSRSYAAGVTDEFILPNIVSFDGLPTAKIQDGDTIIGFNFRGDRMRQLYRALMEPDFAEFKHTRRHDLHFVTMATWGDEITAPRAFIAPKPKTCLSEVMSKHALNQLHMAETEKFPHVTFFFNGQRDEPFPGEQRIMVPSPKEVATYDLKPEMSAVELTDRAVEAIRSRKYDFILLNYANGDMVGHTGVLDAAIKAVETVDHELGRLLNALSEVDATALVTADHGNCETMVDPETGLPHTAHTLNRVPFIIVPPQSVNFGLRAGVLANIAPTILELMKIPVPPEMDAGSLIVR